MVKAMPSHEPSIVNTHSLSTLPLEPGEETIFSVRFHIIILLFRLIVIAALTMGLRFLLESADETFGGLSATVLQAINLAPLVVGGFLGLILVLNYLLTRFLLTTRRAQVRSGILSFGELNIPLSQVDNVDTKVGLFGLVFNYGTIRLASGNSILVVNFAGIPDAKRRGDIIEDLIARAHF